MSRKGYTWDEKYKEEFYKSEKVQAHLKVFIEQASKPKTKEHKEKLSEAKVGRKYSDEHKSRMAESQKFRQAVKREILATNPTITPEELWQQVKIETESHNE
jgi:hypothetical protein